MWKYPISNNSELELDTLNWMVFIVQMAPLKSMGQIVFCLSGTKWYFTLNTILFHPDLSPWQTDNTKGGWVPFLTTFCDTSEAKVDKANVFSDFSVIWAGWNGLTLRCLITGIGSGLMWLPISESSVIKEINEICDLEDIRAKPLKSTSCIDTVKGAHYPLISAGALCIYRIRAFKDTFPVFHCRSQQHIAYPTMSKILAIIPECQRLHMGVSKHAGRNNTYVQWACTGKLDRSSKIWLYHSYKK